MTRRPALLATLFAGLLLWLILAAARDLTVAALRPVSRHLVWLFP